MRQAVREEIERLTAIMIRTVPVERIYLFGSYAYGAPREDSDLDFYIVLAPGTSMREIDAGIKVRLAIRDVKRMPVDILAKRHDAFWARVNAPTLERTVARKGLLLYG